ncbi:MAG: formate dehydrogenase accessory sulfurtransferase FdhD [Acidimicrobiia bacterium]|nr:formate dehydrogenase accessory sulfurtransferase FdhD [Acidimicrobiia bacterium]
MSRGPVSDTFIERIDADGSRRQPDKLIVEEPLSIQLDGTLVATTMRTPGHDFELAAGFCFGDGMLAGNPVQGIRYCGTGSAVETEFNVVTVETGGRAPTPEPRLGPTSSACGLCGRDSIDELTRSLTPLDGAAVMAPEVLAEAPARMRQAQSLFEATGAVHAAAAFDRDGAVAIAREDIGRHNAVDKVVGRLLLDDALPASAFGLCVSGRASFEMVQKAWAAGFGTLVAVSAPSALAVELARAADLTLAGFVRDGVINVYHRSAVS